MICAEQYANRLVVPTRQRTPATRWDSHKDQAAKALKKLVGPHLPASLAQLEKAVARAHRDGTRNEHQPRDAAAAQVPPTAEGEQEEAGQHESVDLVDEAASAGEASGAVASGGSVDSDAGL